MTFCLFVQNVNNVKAVDVFCLFAQNVNSVKVVDDFFLFEKNVNNVKAVDDFCLFVYVTNYQYGSIPVLNELHLVSSGSKSHLISGGDSSCSWVFVGALGLYERKELLTVMWSGEMVMCGELGSSSTFAVRMLNLGRIQTLSLDTVFFDNS